jgi:hypothetical protein
VEAPDFVTHYYLADRRPFLNLSELDEGAVLDVMRELNQLRREGTQRRSFGRTYLAWRRATEARLRDLFIRAGGRPHRLAPHYFCLGTSPWFAGLAADMQSVTLPVERLPAEQTSFTLVDSFSAMGLGPEYGFPALVEAHQQVVYPLSALNEVVGQFGLPAEVSSDYCGFEHRAVNSYVEVQVWTDEPVRGFMHDRG